MSEHITAKEFQKLINDASKLDYKNAIEKMISDIGDDLSLINTKDKVQNLLLENLLPKLNPLFKSNKALKKILEQDRLGEYKQIKKLKDELELQLKDAKERRTLYIEVSRYGVAKAAWCCAVTRAASSSLRLPFCFRVCAS